MNTIAKNAQGDMLFDNGEFFTTVDPSMSEEDRVKESKRIQRDLIQMYIDSALSKGDSYMDVRNHLLRIAPDFKDIVIDTSLDDVPQYRAVWKN